MLALDSTVGCIEASESEVLELYRSSAVIRIPEKLEAYVCAIKKKAGVKVYLALVADDRKIYVYTKQGKADGESDYQQTVERALACARSMGFSPEPVDLSYSPAMREVVVRNTKILRPPGSKVGAFLKHGLSGAPILPIAKEVQQEPPPPPADAPSVVPAPVTSPAVLTTAATVEPPQEPELRGQVLALEQTLSELKKELSAVAAERDAHAAQLQQTSARQQTVAAELACAREECARVGAERDELARYREQWEGLVKEKDDLEGQLRELDGQQRNSLAELSKSREECARLSADRESLEQAVHGAEKASTELVSLQTEVAGLSSRCEEAERLNLELGEERTALAEALSQAREEVEALTAQRDEAFRKAEQLAAESGEAGVQIEAVRGELAALKLDHEGALERIEALERQNSAADGELVALRREVVLLTDKHRKLREKEKEVPGPAASAIETQPSEGAVLPEPPAGPMASEAEPDSPANEEFPEFPDFTIGENTGDTPAKAEHPPVAALRPAGESHKAPGETPSAAAETLPVPGLSHLADRERAFAYYSSMTEETTPSSGGASDFLPLVDMAPDPSPAADQAPCFTPLADLGGNDFFAASDYGSDPVRFLLNSKLDAIEYSSADEVVELHQSINNANLSPEGKGQESCRGYICSLKKGRAMRVFAAIRGTQSGRTRVYLPEEQPQDESSYAKTIRGAISFAEEVGLMMEPVKLDTAALQRREGIERCPALRKVENG